MKVLVIQSCLTATPGTVARQASLSMGFSRQEYWGELSFPSPRDLPDPGMEPESPSLAGRLPLSNLGSPYPIERSCSDGNALYAHFPILWPPATRGRSALEMQLAPLRSWFCSCFVYFLKVFLMWTIFKVFIKFVTILFLSNVLVFRL